MLPTPETRVWSSRARLTPVRRRRSAAHERVVVEQRVDRVAGDVRDLGAAASAPSGGRPRGRRTCAGRRSAARGPPSVEASKPDPQVRLVGRRRRAARAAARSCRGGRAARRRVERAARGTCRAGARRARAAGRAAAAKSSAPGEVPADARGWSTSTPATVRPATQRRQAAPDGLDLGKLGHRSQAPPSTGGTADASGLSPWVARDRQDAVSAACCSASFLRPARRRGRSGSPPTHTGAVKVFAWSGPSFDDGTRGRPGRGRRTAPAGWSSSPGRRRARGRSAISGSKSRCTTSPAVSKPPLEVDRADQRLDACRRGSRTCRGRRSPPRPGPAGCACRGRWRGPPRRARAR